LSNYQIFAASPNLTDAKRLALRFRVKNYGKAGKDDVLPITTDKFVSPGRDGNAGLANTMENRQINTHSLLPGNSLSYPLLSILRGKHLGEHG
jgi:hypothetical protein